MQFIGGESTRWRVQRKRQKRQQQKIVINFIILLKNVFPRQRENASKSEGKINYRTHFYFLRLGPDDEDLKSEIL